MIVDDTDPRIVYSVNGGPDWQVHDSAGSYNGTTTGTSTVGAAATFTFLGTWISVITSIRPSSNSPGPRFTDPDIWNIL